MPATTASKAVLELNGLVLFKYSSIYGYAFEVLTQNSRERVAHGDNEEAVLRKAVEYLEARAVLTGKPMRTVGGNYTSARTGHALDARRYEAIRQIDEMRMKMALLEQEKQKNVRNLSQFPTYDSNVPGGLSLLEYGKGPRGPVPGPEPKEKI